MTLVLLAGCFILVSILIYWIANQSILIRGETLLILGFSLSWSALLTLNLFVIGHAVGTAITMIHEGTLRLW